jgi:hypothetical protein
VVAVKVFQMIAVDNANRRFEKNTVESGFHAAVAAEFTLCGIQCSGDDGYMPGDEVDGYVTCPLCFSIIEGVKKMRNWKPPNTPR